MKMSFLSLVAGLGLALTGCASYQGGTADQSGRMTGGEEVHPQPTASPSFRPGMNPEDVRDPHYTTRPETQQWGPPPN